VKIPYRRFGTDIPETSLRNSNYSLPCVIAQQYSSATFVFLRFHSGNEKFGVRFKNFTISIFYFLKLKTACPAELRNLKLHSRAMSVFAKCLVRILGTAQTVLAGVS
jgi:hypothetical protein